MMQNMVKQALMGVASVGTLAMASAAQAEPPGVYYSWRAMDTTVAQCVSQAEQALESQDLATVQADDISIAGRSEDSTAVFVCLDNGTFTTVMVIVASSDDEQAFDLREALKASF